MRSARMFAVLMAAVTLAIVGGVQSAAAADTQIHGHVTDSEGHALEGIEVCAWPPFSIRPNWSCARTDAAGDYTIPNTYADWFRVRFSTAENKAPGYARQWYAGAGSQYVVTAEQIEAGIDAVMQPGVEVSGTVVNATYWAPLEGVEVCPEENGIGYGQSCTLTDAKGKFALRGLTSGSQTIEFLTAADLNYMDTSITTPSLSSGDSIEEVVYMSPGVEVSGVVTDAATGGPGVKNVPGLPAPRACAVDGISGAMLKCASIGADGIYAIPGLEPGRVFAIDFADDRFVEPNIHAMYDGYVRQYWQGVAKFEQASLLFSTPGAVCYGINAVLARGSDGPATKAPSSNAANCLLSHGGTTPGGGGGTTGAAPSPGATSGSTTATPVNPGQRKRHCKKGFRRLNKGGSARCVKIHHKKRIRHHPKPHRQHPLR